MIEWTPAGAQHVLPGADKIGDGAMAQRRADAPMRPTAPQKPPGGLFGDGAAQLDFADVIQAAGRR